MKQKTNLLTTRSHQIMFKYGKMQRKIPSWLVCGSCGTCLDHTLYGIQVGWDVILYSNHLVCEIMTPCSTGTMQVPCGIVKQRNENIFVIRKALPKFTKILSHRNLELYGIFSVHRYCGRIMDAPVHDHVVTMREWKTILTVFITHVRQIMSLTM